MLVQVIATFSRVLQAVEYFFKVCINNYTKLQIIRLSNGKNISK